MLRVMLTIWTALHLGWGPLAFAAMEDPFPEIRVVELTSGLQIVWIQLEEDRFRWEWDFEFEAMHPEWLRLLSRAVQLRTSNFPFEMNLESRPDHVRLSGRVGWAERDALLFALSSLLTPMSDYSSWKVICRPTVSSLEAECIQNPDRFFRQLWGAVFRAETSTLYASSLEGREPEKLALANSPPSSWDSLPEALLATPRKLRWGMHWREPEAEEYGTVFLLRERWVSLLCRGIAPCDVFERKPTAAGDAWFGVEAPFAPELLDPARGNLLALTSIRGESFHRWDSENAVARFLTSLQQQRDIPPKAWELAKLQFQFQKRFSTDESLYFVVSRLTDLKVSSVVQKWVRDADPKIFLVPESPRSWKALWLSWLP